MMVGLLAKRGCGKDTVADYLVEEYGFTRIAFADALYEEVAQMYGVTVAFLQSRDTKEIPAEVLGGQSPREVLQEHGMLRRENNGADYWVNILRDKMLTENGRYVISDVRMPNEYAMLTSSGGVNIRITRPSLEAERGSGAATDAHVSETALDGAPTRFQLVNHEEDFRGLYTQVDEVMTALGVRKVASVA